MKTETHTALPTVIGVDIGKEVYPSREFADQGGFLAYGPSYPDLYYRAAGFIDKILKGTRPGDLPVEQPTKLELVVNLKTAKALGLCASSIA